MNQTVTNLPFEEGDLKTYVDTSSGILEIELGELENPDVTVVLDYDTAKAIFVDLDAQAGMQAFIAGKIKVTGDLTKLMALQTSIVPNERGMEISQKIKEITA
jgi:putative sterol carrier protein